ncbi:thioredoxin-related protein [Dyadobacter sp. BE34]|uniref:Thioredoxin-related protein n=1 Tax=Dyadobacter fermentans TaxID=94254 RepID=A0ABU1QUU5_9BACT|nr:MULTISPECIES: thioredoxin fold domain-containing protein [Dyadobacter]MDR6804915.1 thioredoxin-related protein [Dyadobacter fermentans]MDR7043326.1 thioredoxin-related protein [Dyadobacter sp. BE242]MDR7197638.1 thioredoxin-related protein [Dyadobacter sp. BE34]MDR7214929.1 thioredoxin-related protein [Dyadobacter sp. BE31]MDR7262464.1 thioredoxin-related protein [Dyadobacter sp. BE32]
MKKILCFMVLIFSSSVCRAEGIDFVRTSWEETLQNAEKSGKQVFLYVRATSCRYCRQMEKEVFVNQEVIDYYNGNFINYKIDVEDGGAGAALAKQYGIEGFPTYLFLSKNGQKLHQSAGAKPAADFIRDGRNASDPNTALFPMLARYEQGGRSPELLFNLSHALPHYMVDANPKEKVMEEYLATQSADELGSERNLRFIFAADLGFKSPTTLYLLQNQQKFVGLFGKVEVEKAAQRIMTRTANMAGRTNDLVLMSELRKVAVEHFPDSVKTLSLLQIYFYGGRRDWLSYGRSTLQYGSTVGATDWQTMYETGIYLKTFAEDPEALKTGVEIMTKVLNLHKNYEHLCIYAELQKKLGNKEPALKAAQEALKISTEQGESGGDAQELINELTVTNK